MSQCTPLELAGQKKLREQFDTDLVRAALAIHEARTKAKGVLPNAEHLWLTRVGLEQCTAWPVAQHKALRFKDSALVLDLCCGIGVDAGNIAAHTTVLAVDNAPSMCVRAGWNIEAWGHADRFESLCGDVSQSEWADKIVHVDPDRRADSDRPHKAAGAVSAKS